MQKPHNIFLNLLILSSFTVFLGRAWQHLYWDAPFRTLLWEEAWLSGIIITFTNMDWEAYITSLEVDKKISLSIKFFGAFYVICAVISLFIKKLPLVLAHILNIGAIGLIFLALLYCKERFFSIGQFFEYTLQFGSPLFLWWYYQKEWEKFPSKTFLLILKIAIALTFTCHGLYAIGYYPIPIQFMEMTMNILGVGENGAKTFLTIAGILDFLIAIGIFLPNKFAKYALGYAVFWGLSTTIARIWAYFDWDWIDYVLLQWLHESIMRMPHFLIPLAVLIMINSTNEDGNRI